jgi:hypothetical protein
MKLFESDHPYYMTEGNYYSNNCHTEWECLDLFLSEYGDADVDRNLVVRWDWREGEDWDLAAHNGSDTDRIARLVVQIIHQRKARLVSHEIKVCRADEPEARAFLLKHAERLAENWSPLLPPPPTV